MKSSYFPTYEVYFMMTDEQLSEIREKCEKARHWKSGVNMGIDEVLGLIDHVGRLQVAMCRLANLEAFTFSRKLGEKDEELVARITFAQSIVGEVGEAEMRAACADCGRLYGHEHGFPDFIIPNYIWNEISPSGDGGGMLCPSCICARLHRAGKSHITGSFMSGPIQSVTQPTMTALRTAENAWAYITALEAGGKKIYEEMVKEREDRERRKQE